MELTQEQLERGQRVLSFSTGVNITPYLYPLPLDEAYVELDLEVSPTGIHYGNLKESSRLFRNSLFSILTPGVLFPVWSNPSVGDIESAFNSSVPNQYRFKDPKVRAMTVYNTPVLMTESSVTHAPLYEFSTTSTLLREKDLIVLSVPNTKYYPVLSNFSPKSSSKFDQAKFGNLALKKIKTLTYGEYVRGDVVYWPTDGTDGLRVILETILIPSETAIPRFIAEGKVSSVKTFSPWVELENYETINGQGQFNPEVIEYDYSEDEFIPDPGSSVPLALRPGGLVWSTKENFTLPAATNDLTGAQAEFMVGASIEPKELLIGGSYLQGQWVFTPQIGGGPGGQDEYYHYVDPSKGVLRKFAYVEEDFTLDTTDLKIKDSFDTLVENGTLTEIVIRDGDNGLPTHLYSPRFKAGDYLEYRENASSEPSYFIATIPFTPSSSDVDVLRTEGVILPLITSTSEKEVFLAGVASGAVKKPFRMFTFFAGDQTIFREGNDIQVYVARKSVTPIFDFPIYLENGVFTPLDSSDPTTSAYIPFFHPDNSRRIEELVIDAKGKNFYRVLRAFTPSPLITSPQGEEKANDSKAEEYYGNLQRIVMKYDCSSPVLSSLGEVSALKLGNARINFYGANQNAQEISYVWGSTDLASETPELFWSGGPDEAFTGYGDGTLAL